MNGTLKIMLKVMIPVLIGVVAVVWLFGREFNTETFSHIHFDNRAIIGIALAVLFFGGRDLGMAWRFRALSDKDLSWRKSVSVTFLCEFTSAITPTSVGGSALSMIFLNREGIKLGRATAITITTLFLDELFFVIAGPIIFLFIPYDSLFGFGSSDIVSGLATTFWIVYAVIVVWTAVLFLGLFYIPHSIKRLLVNIFRLPVIRRWKSSVEEMGDNLIETSREIKGKPFLWWIEAFGATTVSWLSRYLVVNALFFGFATSADQAVVFGRQFIVWALLMFSPTPGGSGVSEWIFTEYYGDLVSSAATVMIIALLWRVITYYIYLLIGAVLLPSFFKKKKSTNKQSNISCQA